MDAQPCLPRAFAPLPMVFASACLAFARLALRARQCLVLLS